MAKYILHDVFLSYRRYEDEARTENQGTVIAEAIYRFLTSKGLKVFWDRPEMEVGPFEEQLYWQLEHSPCYIFIGTEAAKHFRQVTPPNKDYVAEEVRYALKKVQEEKEKDNQDHDRIAFHIIPRRESLQINHSDKDQAEYVEPYPNEILEIEKLQGVELHDKLPTEEDFELILKYATQLNRGNIWNAGFRWYEQARAAGGRFADLSIEKTIIPLANLNEEDVGILPVRVNAKNEKDGPLLEMIENTSGHLYLIGEGGIGKTTSLFSIMEQAYGSGPDENDIDRKRIGGLVPLFIELSKAPDTYGPLYQDGKSTFIHRLVYYQIRQALKAKQLSSSETESLKDVFERPDDIVFKQVHELFSKKSTSPLFLLLLDGLNEVSRTEIDYSIKTGEKTEKNGKNTVISMVLQEIKQLITECPRVRVILTSRSKELASFTDKFSLLYLTGVSNETVTSYLRKCHLSEKRLAFVEQNDKLKAVLRIPLFLSLYASLEGEAEVLTRGEILHLFFHQKKEKIYTIKEQNDRIDEIAYEASQKTQPDRLTAETKNFILDFILPEIAWHMVEDGVFHINISGRHGKDGIRKIISRVLCDRCETSVCGLNGIDTFHEYHYGSYRRNTRTTAEDLCRKLSSKETTVPEKKFLRILISKFHRCFGEKTEQQEVQEDIIGGIIDCSVYTLGILRRNSIESNQDEFSFIHHYIRDYFASVHHMNCLRLAVSLQEKGDNETARKCMSEWKDHVFPIEITRLIGEALGEANNAPIQDAEGNWHYNVPSKPCNRNLIKRSFGLYRGRFEGQDGYCVWNLLEVLKEVRDNLIGCDFSSLDLTGCTVNGHALGEYTCASAFRNSRVDMGFFFSNKPILSVTHLSYSPDGRKMVTVSIDGTITIWDTETYQVLKSVVSIISKEETAYFSTEGDKIILYNRENSTQRVFDIHTFQEIITTANFECETVSLQDTKIMVNENHEIEIRDRRTSAIVGILKGSYVENGAISRDGKYIVSYSWTSVMVWETTTLKEIGPLNGHSQKVTFACFSHDSNYIATSSLDKTIRIWDIKTLQEIRRIDLWYPAPVSIMYSNGGNTILTASIDTNAKLWDSKTYRLLGSLNGQTNHIRDARFSRDGKLIITASIDGRIVISNADTLCTIQIIETGKDQVRYCELSNDNEYIVMRTVTSSYVLRRSDKKIMSSQFTISFFDESHRVLIQDTIHKRYSAIYDIDRESLALELGYSCTFSSDKTRILARRNDSSIDVIDAVTYDILGSIQYAKYAYFDMYGDKIVSSNDSNTAVIYDAHNLCVLDYIYYSDGLREAQFTPDGKHIIARKSNTDDQIIVIINIKTEEKIIEIKNAVDFGFSRNGRYMFVSNIESVRLYETDSYLLKYESDTSMMIPNNNYCFSPDSNTTLVVSKDHGLNVIENGTWQCKRGISNFTVIGLQVMGVDLKNLRFDSKLSEDDLKTLQTYGAIIE